MLTKKIKGNEVKLYNSIKEMPIGNYLDLQIYSVMDAGHGSDVEAVHANLQELMILNQKGKSKEVGIGLANMAQSFELIFQKVNLDLMSFVCFVHSINGKEVTDTSLEGRQEVVTKLAKWRVSIGEVWGLLKDLKKKSTRKWLSIFRLRRKAQS